MSDTPKVVAPRVDFVRLVLSKSQRLKLRFKHKELRNAVTLSKRSIGELVGDPFGGWPYLIAEGHRPYEPTMTLDKASDIIDQFVGSPDPQTQQPRTLDDLGSLLLEGIKASGFISLKSVADDDADAGTEGNEQKEDA